MRYRARSGGNYAPPRLSEQIGRLGNRELEGILLELLEDDVDFADGGFDEAAFRAAQEEEAAKRLERVREVKRGLKEWEGYRLDIVELRQGGGGLGDIFDI